MGIYVNPPGQTKEEFLSKYGTPLPPEAVAIPPCGQGDMSLLYLVDNGFFTALGVMHSQGELTAFKMPYDHRPKRWFMVETRHLAPDLSGISEEEFEFLKKKGKS